MPGTVAARKAVAVLMPSSDSWPTTSEAWSLGATQRPSKSGAKPSQRNCLRRASRAARFCSGIENATRLHIPSHGWVSRPNEKMCRAPSSSICAARSLSRTNVRRPILEVTRSRFLVRRLSAARAAESLTPNSASRATSAAEGSDSVCCHQ